MSMEEPFKESSQINKSVNLNQSEEVAVFTKKERAKPVSSVNKTSKANPKKKDI